MKKQKYVVIQTDNCTPVVVEKELAKHYEGGDLMFESINPFECFAEARWLFKACHDDHEKSCVLTSPISGNRLVIDIDE